MVHWIKTNYLESMTTVQHVVAPSRRVWNDSVRYMPSALVPALTAAAASAIFTRILTPAQYGLYGLTLAFVAPVTTVFGQLAANGSGRFYIEYLQTGRLEVYRQAVTWLIYAVWAACLALLVMALVLTLLTWGPTPLLWMIVGAGFMVAAQSATTILVPILSASFRPTLYSLVVSSSALLSLGLSLVFVWSLGHHSYWLMWGTALSQAMVFPFIVRRFPLGPLKWLIKPSNEAFRVVIQFIQYGAPMVLWVLCASVMGVADRTILQMMDGSAAVGVYAINNSMADQGIGLAAGPMITASWPILMKQWADSGPKSMGESLVSFTRGYLLIGIGIVGAFAVIGQPFEDLFLGSRFTHGEHLLVPCLIGSVFWGAGRLGHSGLKLALRTRILAWDALLAGGFNVALNLLLIPRFGMTGAAYSLIPSFALYAVLIWFQSRTIAIWRIEWREVLGLTVLAMVGWFTARSLTNLIGPSAFVHLLVGGITYAAVFGGVVWIRWTYTRSLRTEKRLNAHG